jgi:hypothetical protein
VGIGVSVGGSGVSVAIAAGLVGMSVGRSAIVSPAGALVAVRDGVAVGKGTVSIGVDCSIRPTVDTGVSVGSTGAMVGNGGSDCRPDRDWQANSKGRLTKIAKISKLRDLEVLLREIHF